MDCQNREKIKNKVLFSVTCALFVLLMALTIALIVNFSSGNKSNAGDFDIGMIISDETEYKDISDMLVPEFVGLTAGGQRSGIALSPNVIKDIFRTVSPTVSYILYNGETTEYSDGEWEKLTELDDSVYVRFHSQLPESVVLEFCDIMNGTEREYTEKTSYIYEMFIIPYSEERDAVTLALRAVNGDTKIYKVNKPEKYLTSSEISVLAQSYAASLTSFTFAFDEYESLSYTEPIFANGIQTKNIIISNRTASFAYNSLHGTDDVLEVFGMNPDKVRSSPSEDDSSIGYIDSNGAFYIKDSEFEYKAASGGGINISEFVGYVADDPCGYFDYIRSAATLLLRLKELDKNYVGADADFIVSSVSSDDGRVTVEFVYCCDNIVMTDIAPALRAVYSDGMMREATVYTVAVRARNDRNESSSEAGFASYISQKKIAAYNVCLKYRADFVAESIKAEWVAESAY